MKKRNFVTINVTKDSPLVEKATEIGQSLWPDLLAIDIPAEELKGYELRYIHEGTNVGVVESFSGDGVQFKGKIGRINYDGLIFYQAIPIREIVGAK